MRRRDRWATFDFQAFDSSEWSGVLSRNVDATIVTDWIHDVLPELTGGAGRGQRNCFVDSPGGDRWFIKQYHHGGLFAGEDDVLYDAPDRFFDELYGALKADQAGVTVPDPVGVLTREQDRGYEGFYLSKRIDGELLSRVLRLDNQWELLEKTGQILADLHEAGIDHLDFHVKNCLVDTNNEVYVTDFDPVEFRIPGHWRRGLRVNRFNRSLDKHGFNREDRERFNDGYNSRHSRSAIFDMLQKPMLGFKNTISDLRYALMGNQRWEKIDREKILVRTPNWLGDAVMSLPCLQLLNDDPWTGRVDVVTRAGIAPLYERSPAVDKVWQIENGKSYDLPPGIGRERYSLAMTIPKSFRTGLQLFRSGIPRRLGFGTQGRGWFLTDCVPLAGRDREIHHAKLYTELIGEFLDLENRELPEPKINLSRKIRIDAHEKFSLPDQYLTIHPGSAFGQAKRWPPDEFNELLTEFIIKEYHIVALGVESEQSIARDVLSELPSDQVTNLVGETSLTECMAVLESSSATVANDSGIMHLSGALGTPTIGIFGSSSPNLTSPLGPKTRVLYEDVECSPCFERTCPRTDDRYKCLTKISPEDVFDELRNEL